MSLTLCVLLWARPGAEDGLITWEDRVLGTASGHGGQVLRRLRAFGGMAAAGWQHQGDLGIMGRDAFRPPAATSKRSA